MTEKEQFDFDSPWKDILDIYFEDFISFFFPQAYADIDWSKKYEALDNELQQIIKDSELRKRIVDKLIKVWLKNGEESWILIHIEIQSQRESNFAKRMYVYNYRIFDKYDRFVISLALLGDENPLWRPNYFGYELWGFKAGIEFPIVKLLDYRNRWEELENSRNPFALVVMSHLKTLETKSNSEDRRKWKFLLARRLYEHEYERKDIVNLLRFIDWVMHLPKELDASFWQEIRHFEEMRSMPYISSIERIAIEQGLEKGLKQGLQQGLQQGIRRSLMQVLNIRFKLIPEDVISKINNITNTETLETLHSQAVVCDSIDEFKERLNNSISE